MDQSFDPGALLAHSWSLPRGPRVRLRLLRPADAPAVRELTAQAGEPLTELGLARLLRADPSRQVALCATALVEGHERVVGLASMGLAAAADPEPQPDLLVVDGQLTDGLDELLCRALVGRARALAGARAA